MPELDIKKPIEASEQFYDVFKKVLEEQSRVQQLLYAENVYTAKFPPRRRRDDHTVNKEFSDKTKMTTLEVLSRKFGVNGFNAFDSRNICLGAVSVEDIVGELVKRGIEVTLSFPVQ
jgi:hypothetical protein